MGLSQLASKLGLSTYDAQALIYHLRLRDDPDSYLQIAIGKSLFKRYSLKALERLLRAKESLGAEVRNEYKQRTLTKA
jgi:hypothetical protein